MFAVFSSGMPGVFAPVKLVRVQVFIDCFYFMFLLDIYNFYTIIASDEVLFKY